MDSGLRRSILAAHRWAHCTRSFPSGVGGNLTNPINGDTYCKSLFTSEGGPRNFRAGELPIGDVNVVRSAHGGRRQSNCSWR